MNDERLYTTEQARQALGITDARIRQIAIASNGEIGRKWGRDWMFTDADLDRMRQRNTSPGPKGPRAKEGQPE
jgi:hypothetical protein